MPELWFWIVSVMVAAYVVLDGFDFGAGILHLFVARDNRERREVLAAIGPLWDGNEVWLLAAGGAMFVAFPRVLASGFSGFYLVMFLVVWTLILRGIAIEFRSHVGDSLWRAFWDGVFACASLILPVLLGAALGNVLRGVPVDQSGYFSLPLWSNFRPGAMPGVLDWYTVLVGGFALVAIAAHGSLFLAWKTAGPVRERALVAARWLWPTVVVLWAAVSLATWRVNPGLFRSLIDRPLAWIASLILLAGLVVTFVARGDERDLLAFLGSSAFLLGALAAGAACAWPVMLRSTLDSSYSLTAVNSAVELHGLRAALGWWMIGFPLALAYFVYLFRVHRGKVEAAAEGEGY